MNQTSTKAGARLGIIAGEGDLPGQLVLACKASGRECFVLAIAGDPGRFTGTLHAVVRVGAAGRVISLLHDAGVEEVVFAGAIRRPTMAQLRPDWRAARFLARQGWRLAGSDRVMSAVIEAFEREEGFRVIGPHEVLADLLPGPGPLGRHRPDQEDERDIALGVEVARQLGALDIGQAVVVQQGVVLAVEAAEGTDALISRSAALKAGAGGVLVKVKKPQQDRRADPPVIGRTTVALAGEAGLHGIAIQAGATLVVERAAVVAAADAAGMFIVGVEAPA